MPAVIVLGAYTMFCHFYKYLKGSSALYQEETEESTSYHKNSLNLNHLRSVNNIDINLLSNPSICFSIKLFWLLLKIVLSQHLAKYFVVCFISILQRAPKNLEANIFLPAATQSKRSFKVWGNPLWIRLKCTQNSFVYKCWPSSKTRSR